MRKIRSVAVVGGTHGNELTGVYLCKKWSKNPDLLTRPELSVETVLANPKAYKANRRFMDSDLNRQFVLSDLANPLLADYEQSRAKVLNAQLGPKGDAKTDFIIDMHNTTSNMGPCVLLVQKAPIYNLLAGYIKTQMPEAVIVCDEDHVAHEKRHLLCTVGKYGIILEIGPQPQGVLRQDIFEQMERLTYIVLDFLVLYNTETLPKLPQNIEAYRYLHTLKLPVDENSNPVAMVHQNIQDQDFNPLNRGEPIFMGFDGTVYNYEGDSTVYPHFVNEAAYYNSNTGLSIAEKIELPVYI